MYQNTDNHSDIKREPYNVMCILGFVIALISFFINFWGIMGIIALVLSIMGYNQSKQRQESRKALAIAGMIIGCCSILYGCYVLVELSKINRYYY